MSNYEAEIQAEIDKLVDRLAVILSEQTGVSRGLIANEIVHKLHDIQRDFRNNIRDPFLKKVRRKVGAWFDKVF